VLLPGFRERIQDRIVPCSKLLGTFEQSDADTLARVRS
jgi:hypothetical protein